MMNLHKGALGFLFLLMVCAVALGQQPGKDTAKETDRARFDELRTKGFEALYSLDYEGARRQFKELVRLYPDHPAGPQFLAATLWTQSLNNSRRLQSSLYNSESFYAKNEDKVNQKTVDEFRNYTRQAKLLAEARLKRDPKDVEALYFLGATEGLKAAFSAAVQRSFISSLRDGQRSVDRHREVIKLDPAFHDAEVTIGLYDYVVGSLPLPVKLLASVTGARGSKKRGLEALERVTREGRWARDDAKSLLIVLYKREKRFADALAISRDLGAKYPRNYLYQLEAADALVSIAASEREANKMAAAQTAEREAFNIFDALLRDKSNKDTAPRPMDLIHFRYGEVLLTAGQFERAAREFLASANTPGAEAGLITMAHLQAARAFDVAGKRNEALAQYRVVLSRPNVYDSQDKANEGLREPYKIKNGAKSNSD
jgi:hypothetical protein